MRARRISPRALGFRTGARVDLEIGALPPDHALAPGVREAIFRVAQEGLSNVARHARAGHVRVSLGLIDDQLVLTSQDDGCGFASGGASRGMGMANMAARAAEIGGQLEVTSRPGGGTSVRLAVPSGPPSLRPYAARAAGWMVVLLASVAYLATRGMSNHPWGATLGVLGAIGVTRYAVAVYWIRRGRVPA